jgi:hypothetical protein
MRAILLYDLLLRERFRVGQKQRGREASPLLQAQIYGLESECDRDSEENSCR